MALLACNALRFYHLTTSYPQKARNTYHVTSYTLSSRAPREGSIWFRRQSREADCGEIKTQQSPDGRLLRN